MTRQINGCLVGCVGHPIRRQTCFLFGKSHALPGEKEEGGGCLIGAGWGDVHQEFNLEREGRRKVDDGGKPGGFSGEWESAGRDW